MKKVLLMLIIGLVFVLFVCGGGSFKNEFVGEFLVSVEDIVKKNCIGCYGVDLGGVNGLSL